MDLLALAWQHKLAILEGTLGVTLVPLFWKAARFLSFTLFEWAFSKKSIDNDWTAGVLLGYLNDKAKSFGFADDTYRAQREPFKMEDGENHTVFFLESSESKRLFIYKGVPLILIPSNTPEGKKKQLPYIRFLRGTLNWEQLLLDAAAYHDELWSEHNQTNKRFKVVRHSGIQVTEGSPDSPPKGETTLSTAKQAEVPIGHAPEELGLPISERPMEDLALTDKMKEVVDEVKFWHKHRTWYRRKRIPWRYGVGLFGKPGTGKTSLVRAIAEEMDLPIHIFDLTTMDNHDFIRAWGSARANAPRIVLFEDFDNVFHGRQNVLEGSELSFDCILNSIDGIEREDGLLLFVTTNHIHHLDEAMGTLGADGRSTRPGRIDKIVEILPIGHDGRLKIAHRILDDDLLAEKMAFEGANDSAAQFQNRCREKAKEILWGSFAISRE